jgi:hypothetical protein
MSTSVGQKEQKGVDACVFLLNIITKIMGTLQRGVYLLSVAIAFFSISRHQLCTFYLFLFLFACI